MSLQFNAALPPAPHGHGVPVNLLTAKTGRCGEGITAEDMLTLTWVTPRLLDQVAFTEWTAGGSLRHAAFVGLRTDKPATQVGGE